MFMFLVFFTCTCNRHIYKSASKFCVHNRNIPSCLQTKTEHHRHRPSSFLHLRKRFVFFMLVQKQRFSNFRRTPTSGLFYLFYVPVSVSTGVVLIFISTILELNIKLHSPFHPLFTSTCLIMALCVQTVLVLETTVEPGLEKEACPLTRSPRSLSSCCSCCCSPPTGGCRSGSPLFQVSTKHT